MGSKNVEKWIDLSGLPKIGDYIDWTNSIGHTIPFQYEKIKGFVNIVGLGETREKILITIDKYMPKPYSIYLSNLRKCELRKLVYNKIVDARSDLIQYLDNPNNSYQYSIGSHKEIGVHCPLCGYQTKICVNDLSMKGFHCPICGKGFSYPSKLMTQILLSLKIPFIREASKKNAEFQWAENYRYDFYIQLNGRKIIIEMDGWFHQYNQEIDDIKNSLAYQNGFEVVRIDCNYKYLVDRFEYIKNNILRSKLASLLSLYDINWEQCNELALRESPIQMASLLWENEYKSIKEISELCFVNREVVLKYLKIGKQIGLCPSYNPQESEIRSHCKCVAIYDSNNQITHTFRSATETSALSKKELGVSISVPMVCFACTGRSKTAKGFKMIYISYDEYRYYQNIKEQSKMIKNNNKVVKEVV